MFRNIRQRMASILPGTAGRMRREDQRLLREAVALTKGRDCNIVFVCQGNICRSPLAAGLLKRALADAGKWCEIQSYGNIPRVGANLLPMRLRLPIFWVSICVRIGRNISREQRQSARMSLSYSTIPTDAGSWTVIPRLPRQS